jgi:hypothetical protein
MHHSGTPARRSAAIAVLAALALIPRALAAEEASEDEIPAGHLYFGLAGEAAQPFGRALISRNALKLGTATGLYLHFEGEHFLARRSARRGTCAAVVASSPHPAVRKLLWGYAR